MINKAIEGTTRRIGKAQGYKGLAIRDQVDPDWGPQMVTAWEPTPDEINLIKLGASIEITILGQQHPPIMVTVGNPPDPDIENPYPPKEPENA